MRVFVLSTGRSGTTTFVEACKHASNYTAGHETRAAQVGRSRFDYPDGHIEADNRLSWFLGALNEAYGSDPLYVHLLRDREATADSFLRRWDYKWRGGIIEAFAHALVMHAPDWPDENRLDVCRWYVDTVNANIRLFLRDKRHLTIWLEDAARRFPIFWSAIGAEGDLDLALGEFEVRHNPG